MKVLLMFFILISLNQRAGGDEFFFEKPVERCQQFLETHQRYYQYKNTSAGTYSEFPAELKRIISESTNETPISFRRLYHVINAAKILKDRREVEGLFSSRLAKSFLKSRGVSLPTEGASARQTASVAWAEEEIAASDSIDLVKQELWRDWIQGVKKKKPADFSSVFKLLNPRDMRDVDLKRVLRATARLAASKALSRDMLVDIVGASVSEDRMKRYRLVFAGAVRENQTLVCRGMKMKSCGGNLVSYTDLENMVKPIRLGGCGFAKAFASKEVFLVNDVDYNDLFSYFKSKEKVGL